MLTREHRDYGQVDTAERAQPILRQRAPEIQPYGTMMQDPIALARACGRRASRL